MRKLLVIGIGAGDPDYLTVQAIKALNQVEVFFVLDKGAAKEDLVRLRRLICDRYVETPRYRVVEAKDPVRDPKIADYAERVEAWHAERAALYAEMFARELGEDGCGGILAWGDPALYDSTLRILDQVIARGTLSLSYEVIPGISAVQVLAAKHRIALNRIGGPIHVTTGRRLLEGDRDHDDIVVMLDGDCAFQHIDPQDIDIYWGAYLGTDDELLVAGDLRERGPEIVRLRAEARARKGWIMDTYLLRRRASKK